MIGRPGPDEVSDEPLEDLSVAALLTVGDTFMHSTAGLLEVIEAPGYSNTGRLFLRVRDQNGTSWMLSPSPNATVRLESFSVPAGQLRRFQLGNEPPEPSEDSAEKANGWSCRTCGLNFTSVTGFDAHRVGQYERPGVPGSNTRRCLTGDELREKGYEPDDQGRWRRPDRGQWRRPERGSDAADT